MGKEMRFFMGLYLAVGILELTASGGEENLSPLSCPSCEVDHCPKTARECSHGLVRDKCACCKEGVCLLKEGEKCLNLRLFRNITQTDMKKFGACGEHMECLLRADLRAGEVEESVCRCRSQEVSCGKDNVTYPSICRLLEAESELKHLGACTTPPQIVSEPEVANPSEDERLSLSCEAKGFPVPRVHWEFEGFDGIFKSLPGDDPSIAVHSRGGPEPLTVTSWLMIEALRPRDAGAYICVAKNSEGAARSVVSVHVQTKTS